MSKENNQNLLTELARLSKLYLLTESDTNQVRRLQSELSSLDDVVEVEIATFEWVSWWNETRLHQSLGYRTPVEVETDFWKQTPPQEIITINANA